MSRLLDDEFEEIPDAVTEMEQGHEVDEYPAYAHGDDFNDDGDDDDDEFDLDFDDGDDFDEDDDEDDDSDDDGARRKDTSSRYMKRYGYGQTKTAKLDVEDLIQRAEREARARARDIEDQRPLSERLADKWRARLARR